MSRSILGYRSFSRSLILCFAVSLTATGARAQMGDSVPASPNQVERGPDSAPSQSTLGSDNEDAPINETLPPGHPPVGATQVEPSAESGTLPGERLARDTVSHSNSVPVGAIEIHVLDGENHPVSGAAVIVQLHRESISEGNTETKREVVTDASGVAQVDHLLTDSAVSYRVTVSDGGIAIGMPPFQLNEHAGAIVTMHKYPMVRDLKQAMVAMQSLVFVEPKDDVFQFEVVYDLFNIGRTTWVPEKQTLHLPTHWKGFNAQQSTEDVRVESVEDGVRLTGAVTPGQHQIVYTFQVPRKNTASAAFELDLPPNVMMAKVGLASSRSAELSVDGFSDPEPTASQNGQRLLVTSKTFDRSIHMPTELKLEVRGLPTLGVGRVVAAVVAIILAATGLLFALLRRGRTEAENAAQSLQERARLRLIEELTELETAKLSGRIGPRTYQETRSALIDALVRLEPIPE